MGHSSATTTTPINWLKNAALLRSFNTLHGFNAFTDDDSLLIGTVFECRADSSRTSEWGCISDAARYQRIVNEAMHGDAVTFGSMCTSDFVRVHKAFRRRIPEVIDALLAAGLAITLQTRLEVRYAPADAPFSIERSERLAVAKLVPYYTRRDDGRYMMPSHLTQWGDERLWKTEEGRVFSRRLLAIWPNERERCSDEVQLVAERDGVVFDERIDYPRVACPAIDDQAAAERIAKKRKTDDDEFVCMICMDARPATVVHPCLHCVACVQCSAKLRLTNDARTCVRCRRAIASIDE